MKHVNKSFIRWIHNHIRRPHFHALLKSDDDKSVIDGKRIYDKHTCRTERMRLKKHKKPLQKQLRDTIRHG